MFNHVNNNQLLHLAPLDSLILILLVFNVRLDLIHVLQTLMELIVYKDFIYLLHGLIVQDVRLKLLLVPQLLTFNHVVMDIMEHQLTDMMLLVQPVQQLEMLLIVIMLPMLQVVNLDLVQKMEYVKAVQLIQYHLMEPLLLNVIKDFITIQPTILV